MIKSTLIKIVLKIDNQYGNIVQVDYSGITRNDSYPVSGTVTYSMDNFKSVVKDVLENLDGEEVYLSVTAYNGIFTYITLFQLPESYERLTDQNPVLTMLKDVLK